MSALISLQVHLTVLLQTKYGFQKLPSRRSNFSPMLKRWLLLGSTQNIQDLKKLRTLYENSYFAGTYYMEKILSYYFHFSYVITKYELNNKRNH
jgi:hypothetical protein